MKAELCERAGAPAVVRGALHGDRDAASQLRHAPLMKVLGLPGETNPQILGEVLERIAEEGPHRAVALVRQSALMALLPPAYDPAALASALVRLARMSRLETVLQALRR
jgi:hypothetical protein